MADTAPEGWRGPFVGEDAYGNPDHEYYQYVGCGVEVVTSTDVETVNHAEGCEVAE